jgi:uncharacterized protein
MGKTTLVLGASENPDRYSNRAVRKLIAYGHRVVAVGRRDGKIDEQAIRKEAPSDVPIDTVTVYLNARNQKEWESAVLDLSPSRIIFNPGAENRRLADAARARGIEVLEACTLVMLGTGQY